MASTSDGANIVPGESVVEGRERIFPRLTSPQLERMAAQGVTRPFVAGEILIESGHAIDRFYAITQGQVEILRPTLAGDELIVVHETGEFVGDVHTLSGRRSIVRARARTDGTAIELSRDSLLSLIR